MTYNSSYFPAAGTQHTALKRWLCWLSAPLLLFIPLLFINHTMFFGNWDAVFYSNVLSLYTDALTSGDIYPRWFANANGGFGSPVMMFYVPGAYLLTALINLPLFALHLSINTQFIIGIYASQAVSGYTAWLWLKRSFPARTALTCSLLFVLLPYKLIYIYEHINLAQLWALAFLPLWMIAAEKMLMRGNRVIALYALSVALVYYIHPLTVIAFGAAPACFVLWFGRRDWHAIIIKLLLAHILAAGLCLMQALPQQQYLDWISAEEFLSGKHAWKHNLYHIDIFLCAYYGMIAGLMSYAAVRILARRVHFIAAKTLFWTWMLAAVLFLMLPLSAFVWEHVPVMHYLQFPAGRLHSVALMAAIYCIAVWLTYYKEMLKLGPLAYRKSALIVLIAIFTCATCYRLYGVYTTRHDLTEHYVEASHEAKIIVPAEYKTAWGCIDVGKALNLYEQHALASEIIVNEGSASNLVSVWQPPQRIIFSADVASPDAEIMLRQCYIPSWDAKDETGKEIALSPSHSLGLVQMNLPQGKHTIEVALLPTALEKVSRWITLGSIIICLIIFSMTQKRRT